MTTRLSPAKRFAALLLALTLSFSMAACSKTSEDDLASDLPGQGETELSDYDALVHEGLQLLHGDEGKYDEAAALFTDAIALCPTEDHAYCLLAEAYEAMGAPDAAIETLYGALEVVDDTVDIRDDLQTLTTPKAIEELSVRVHNQAELNALALRADADQITHVNCHEAAITDLSALRVLTNLRELNLNSNYVDDLSPLSELRNLTELAVNDNSISDLSPLSKLYGLKKLHLSGNRISDISALSRLLNLRELNLEENDIGDVSVLVGLLDLTYLVLDENRISDITPVINLPHLQTLMLNGNNVSDISALGTLSAETRLQFLGLNENGISDISVLRDLPVGTVALAYNQISDVSMLRGMSGVYGLSLRGNNISDISALAETSLTELVLRDNKISDVSALGESSLTDLDLRGNKLTMQQVADLQAQLPNCEIAFK